MSSPKEQGQTLRFALVDPNDERFTQAWNRHISASNPECSLDHIRILMKCDSENEHHCLLGEDQAGGVVVVAYLVARTIPVVLGWKPRVLTLGGELSGDALWFDGSVTSYENVVGQLVRFCRKHIGYTAITLKPFDFCKDGALLASNEKRLKLINVFGSTRGDVDLSDVASYEDYLAAMGTKKRYYLRKVEREAIDAGLDVSVTSDFTSDVPLLYDLYLSVYERAAEVKDLQAFPLRYFECLAEAGARMVIVRREGRIVAFCLLMEEDDVLGVGVCGMDHAISKQLNLWYVLMLWAIKRGIELGKRAVFLGTTNYHMKRKFAAVGHDLWISIGLRSRMATFVLAPFVRAWLRRNIFIGASDRVSGEMCGRFVC